MDLSHSEPLGLRASRPPEKLEVRAVWRCLNWWGDSPNILPPGLMQHHAALRGSMQIQCSLPTLQGTLIAAPLAVLLDVVNLGDQKSQEVNGEAVSTDVTYSQFEGCSSVAEHNNAQLITHSSVVSLHAVSHILGHRDGYGTERGLVGGIQSAVVSWWSSTPGHPMVHGPFSLDVVGYCHYLKGLTGGCVALFASKWHKIKINILNL